MVDQYARVTWLEIRADGPMVEEVGLEVMLGYEVDTATRRSDWDEKTGLMPRGLVISRHGRSAESSCRHNTSSL